MIYEDWRVSYEVNRIKFINNEISLEEWRKERKRLMKILASEVDFNA